MRDKQRLNSFGSIKDVVSLNFKDIAAPIDVLIKPSKHPVFKIIKIKQFQARSYKISGNTSLKRVVKTQQILNQYKYINKPPDYFTDYPRQII